MLPSTDISRTETESSYLAYLSITTNLDGLRLGSILHTFLPAFNYNNFISHVSSCFKIKLKNYHFHTFFLPSNWQRGIHKNYTVIFSGEIKDENEPENWVFTATKSHCEKSTLTMCCNTCIVKLFSPWVSQFYFTVFHFYFAVFKFLLSIVCMPCK